MRSFLGIGKKLAFQSIAFELPKKTVYVGLAWLLLFVAILSTASIVRIVLHAPQRTPFFVFSAEYDIPWSQQSHSACVPTVFQSLHRRNLQCELIGDGTSFRDADWIGIEETIRRYDSQTRLDVPLLFYIGFHGVVDNDGQPCLLVSHSTPNRPDTWLSVQELFHRISKSASQNRNLVFLFPHGTIPSHLSDASTLSFSSALSSLLDRMVRDSHVHRIACITDDGTNDLHVRPMAENGSLTMAIADALNGEADRAGIESNRNNVVEWDELITHVQSVYSAQTIADRGITARIHSIVHGPAPTSIAWALTSPSKKVSEPLPTMELQEELEAAWLRFGSLQSQRPWLTQPALWTELKHMGLALERDLFSGNLDQGVQRIAEFRRLADAIERSAGKSNPLPRAHRQEIAKRFAEQWQVIAQKNVDSWKSFCNQLHGVAPDESRLDPMLYHLSRSPSLAFWDQPSLIREFASQRFAMEKHRESRIDLPADPVLVSLEERLLESCRRLQDRVLANQPTGELIPLMKRLNSSWEEYTSRYQEWLMQTSDAIELAREIPRLCLAVDALSLAEAPVDGQPSVPGQPSINGLATMHSLAQNCIQELADRSNVPFIAKKDSISQRTKSEQSESNLARLQSHVYKAWGQLLKSTEKHALIHLQLDRLLQSGAMPSSGDSYKDGIVLRMQTLRALAAWDGRERERNTSAKTVDVKPGKLWNEWRKAVLSNSGQENDSKLEQSFLIAHSRQGLWADSEATAVVNQFAAQWRQMQLLRAASIVLDDYWQWDESDADPYFAIEAERLLKEAESIRSTPKDEPSIAAIREKLTLRRQAAMKPFEFTVEWKLRSSSQQIPGWESFVRQTTLGQGLPAGEAYVPSVGNSASPSILTIGSNRIAQSLGVVLGDQTETWTPSLTFRGRRYSGKPFPSNTAAITTTSFDKDRRTSFIIHDGRKQKRARTVILDCSASMAESIATEGIGRSSVSLPLIPNSSEAIGKNSVSKLDAARVALRQVLEQWRGGDDWVGFSLFGHRVASSPGAGNLLQVKYMRSFPFPQDLQAYDDVETILSVGRFGDAEFASVLERLNHLVPWGQTPLYMAILDALERMRTVDPALPRDIVVVSDGRNYQFNPPAERNIPLEWVIDVAREQSVRIHLIGFGIPADEMWEATQQYQRLASETGGTVVMQVADAMTLVQNFKAHESPFQYQLQLPESEPIVAQANQEVQLPLPRTMNTPLTIDFGGDRKVVPINQGAAIQMRTDSGKLVSTGYTGRPVELRTPLVDRLGRATPFVLVISRPMVERDALHWEFSLERTDGEISQRPRNVLVEIEPKRDGNSMDSVSSSRIYASTETNWKSQSSVPTLSMTTSNWPQDTTEAEVRFWCADSDWEPMETVSGMSSSEATSASHGFSYKVLVDDRGIAVCIQQADGNVKINDIYPRLLTDRSVLEVERRFLHESSLAMHRFQWDLDQVRESHRDKIRIDFCDANVVRTVGLRPASPIRIPMSPRIAGRESSSRR